MTLVSQIVTDAFRETNLVSVTGTPVAAEVTEAVRLLNRYITALFGQDMGEPLSPIAMGRGATVITPDNVPLYMEDIASFYVPSNTRLQCNLTAAASVNLNPQPMDGARFAVIDDNGSFSSFNLTVKGNGRKIEGSATKVLSTANQKGQWFYRDDTGNWANLVDLVSADDSPFPEEFDDMLAIGLAIRLSPRNGPSISPESLSVYKDLKNKFQARYRQSAEIPTEQGIVRLPSNRMFRRAYDSTRDFARGISIW